ncbi:MAG TPA: right-handed parallel beta-helix repeat-containing protein [Candidatus Binatia bacterium]|jgi:hypothetical protein
MWTSRRLVLACCAALLISPRVHAATLLVAGNGVDSPDCGGKTAPCRSISRAVALAGQGDTILVGPGRYGDIDQSGTFIAPGDEAAEVGTGCNCMLHVTKRVTIVSRDGAGTTILDANGATIDVVRIDAAATIFGKKGQGFTLTGAKGAGNGLVTEAESVTIAGNIAFANSGNGIAISAGHAIVSDNRAVANADGGIDCSGTNDSTFARNTVIGNGNVGLEADNRNVLTDNLALDNVGPGIDAQSGNTLKGDVALGNGDRGIQLDDDNTVTACVANANHNGINLAGHGNTVTKSAVLDNFGVGILVGDVGNTISKTNLFGNGMGVVNVPNANFNCATLMSAAGALQATQNFWGAPTGPGLDPADAACNAIGGTTNLVPVATKEIKVRPPAAH